MKTKEIIETTNVKSVTDFLYIAPRDELYTLKELSERFNIPESTLKTSRSMNNYKVKYGNNNYYGSPQAIAAFLEQTKENNETE